MKKFKTLYYSALKSITSIDYYREILTTKISFSYKYFIGLSLILSIALSTRFAIVQVPIILKDLEQTGIFAKNMFESDLVIELKDGGWSINKPEPYAINVTSDVKKDTGFGDHEHFIILAHEGTIDKFDEYDTYLLINSKNVISKDASGFKTNAIADFDLPSGTITKQDFDGFIDSFMKYLKWVPLITTFFAFVGLLFYFVLVVGTNMFVIAVAIWFIGQVVGLKSDGKSFSISKIKYFDCVRITIHASTLPLILFTITRIIGFEGFTKITSIWQELLTLILAAFIVWMLEKDKGNKALTQHKNNTVVEKDTNSNIETQSTPKN